MRFCSTRSRQKKKGMEKASNRKNGKDAGRRQLVRDNRWQPQPRKTHAPTMCFVQTVSTLPIWSEAQRWTKMKQLIRCCSVWRFLENSSLLRQKCTFSCGALDAEIKRMCIRFLREINEARLLDNHWYRSLLWPTWVLSSAWVMAVMECYW